MTWDDVVAIGLALPEEKAPLLAAHAGPLFTTPHYDRSAYVCVALPLVGSELLTELLEDAWALRAPAKTVAAWLEARG